VCADRSPRGAPAGPDHGSPAASPPLPSVGATYERQSADHRHPRRCSLAENGFAALGARPETVQALEQLGITTPFAIQTMTLPIALAGHDLIGQARTGTGKTLGFGVPLLQRVKSRAEGSDGQPQALVVAPTRELAVQVATDIEKAGSVRGIRVVQIYGGAAFEPQVETLRKGVEVVVGTPGRLLDLARQGHLDLSAVQVLVLDEADEMLDLGFLPDVERILELLPTERQTMLFSATMPGPVVTMARRFMKQPTHIRAEEIGEKRTVPDTRIFVYRRTRWTRARCWPASCRPRAAADDGLLPHQADLRQGRRRHGRPRLRRRRRARRPRPGRPRAGAARLPLGEDRRAGRHRRRGPRHRRPRRHARHQLPVPGRGEHLPAPDRPHRPSRRQGRRGDLRGLGRHAEVGADQQGSRAAHPGAARDLLLLQAPLHRPLDPRGDEGHPAAFRPRPRRSGCRAGRGPR
jgi:hypothetical protein